MKLSRQPVIVPHVVFQICNAIHCKLEGSEVSNSKDLPLNSSGPSTGKFDFQLKFGSLPPYLLNEVFVSSGKIGVWLFMSP